MSNERPSLQQIWNTQTTEGFAMPLDEIRAKSVTFQRRIRNRNIREYAAFFVVAIVFAHLVLTLPGLATKAGCVLVILGASYALWQLHRRAAAALPPETGSLMDVVAFHRGELIRQRDALQSITRWYLAPLVPGFAVFLYGLHLHIPSSQAAIFAPLAMAGVILVTFGLIRRLNRLAAQALQQSIDALDRIGIDSSV
jgi:hypothetical protein